MKAEEKDFFTRFKLLTHFLLVCLGKVKNHLIMDNNEHAFDTNNSWNWGKWLATPTADLTTIGPTIPAASTNLTKPINNLHATVTSKTDTRRPVSSEARVHSQANTHRVYGAHCATVTGLSPSISAINRQYQQSVSTVSINRQYQLSVSTHHCSILILSSNYRRYITLATDIVVK